MHNEYMTKKVNISYQNSSHQLPHKFVTETWKGECLDSSSDEPLLILHWGSQGAGAYPREYSTKGLNAQVATYHGTTLEFNHLDGCPNTFDNIAYLGAKAG